MVWRVLGGGGVASRAEAAGWKPARTQEAEGAEGETLEEGEEGEEAVEARDGGGHVGGVVRFTQIVYIGGDREGKGGRSEAERR